MADPQENAATAGQTRARSDASPSGSHEPRTFDETKVRTGGAGERASETLSQAAQPLVEGGRQLAEQSRRASREMADVWRQAVDPLMAMQYDISQWFDDVFRHTFGFRNTPGAAALRPFGHISAVNLFGLPPADMKETETAHVLAIELPGLSREDVDLAIDGDALIVSGHKAEQSDDVSATYRMSERRYGRFERAFPLPPDVDRGRIEAQFRDGLLKITLPKNPDVVRAKSRIEIKG